MTMNRRAFLRNASILAAGAVAVDQLELVERLGWSRKLFPGWSRPTLHGDGVRDDTAALQALADGREVYDERRGRVIGGREIFLLAGTHHLVAGTVRFNYPGQRGEGTIMGSTFHGVNQPAPIFQCAASPFPSGMTLPPPGAA